MGLQPIPFNHSGTDPTLYGKETYMRSRPILTIKSPANLQKDDALDKYIYKTLENSPNNWYFCVVISVAGLGTGMEYLQRRNEKYRSCVTVLP